MTSLTCNVAIAISPNYNSKINNINNGLTIVPKSGFNSWHVHIVLAFLPKK